GGAACSRTSPTTCSIWSRRSSARATSMRRPPATAAVSRAARAAAWVEATESVAAAGLPMLPYLAPWYRLAEVEDGLVLEHGHAVVRLDGAAVRRLLAA